MKFDLLTFVVTIRICPYSSSHFLYRFASHNQNSLLIFMLTVMMNSLPAAIDALYQTITVHVTDPNDADITWVVEVTFVSWSRENWVILGRQVVNCGCTVGIIFITIISIRRGCVIEVIHHFAMFVISSASIT